MPRTIFLTGATGLLGSYLLKLFLANGHKVYVLGRSKQEKTAQQRVREALNFWDPEANFNNCIVFEGDITKPYLGLNMQPQELLRIETEEIFHCAAVTNLRWPLEAIREVNVQGLRNILQLAANLVKNGRLKKTNHISTAFVYGDYKAEFKETNLEVNQSFKTTYEQSKFEAEQVACQFRKSGLWVDIYRPPIIIGHSQNGKIFSFRNIYQLVHICSLRLFNILPVSNPYVNLAPVDLLSKGIYLLSQNAQTKNETYHPFSAKQVAVQDIINIACNLMAIKPIKVIEAKDFDLTKLTSVQRAILFGNMMALEFKARLNSDFTLGILKNLGMTIPGINTKMLTSILGYYIEQKNLRQRVLV